MRHIKDYWRESEVFHASNLNEIAKVINSLIDKCEALINDNSISKESTYSSKMIVDLIENAGFKISIVDVLPESGDGRTIYFVPSQAPILRNTRDEYIWCDGKWELIGSTSADFSNYYTKSEVDEAVDTLEGMISDKADVSHTHNISDVNELQDALNRKQNKIEDLDDIRRGAALGATAIQEMPTVTVPQVIAVLEGQEG